METITNIVAMIVRMVSLIICYLVTQVSHFTARICAVSASVIAVERCLIRPGSLVTDRASFRVSMILAYASLISVTVGSPDGLNVRPTAFCQNVSS